MIRPLILVMTVFVLTSTVSGQDTLQFGRTTTIQTLGDGNFNIATNPMILQQTLDSIYVLHARMTDSLQAGTVTGTSKFLRLLETLETGGDATVGGALTVTGATNLNSTLNAGSSTLSSAAVTGDASVDGALIVTGPTSLNSLFAGPSQLSSAVVANDLGVVGDLNVNDEFTVDANSGNTTVGGDFLVNGTAVFNSLNLHAVSPPPALPAPWAVDSADAQKSSHVLSVEGGYQGVYVGLEPQINADDINRDQHFMTFARAEYTNEWGQNVDGKIVGTIEGNQQVSAIGALIETLGDALEDSGNSQAGGIACSWKFHAFERNPADTAIIVNLYDNNNNFIPSPSVNFPPVSNYTKYLLFFVEGAPKSVFDAADDIEWFGTFGYEGKLLNPDHVQDNGDCTLGEGYPCYQGGYFKIYDPTDISGTQRYTEPDSNQFLVYANFDVSIQYLETYDGLGPNPPWTAGLIGENPWGSGTVPFSWSLYGGDESKQFNTLDDFHLGDHMGFWFQDHTGLLVSEGWPDEYNTRNPTFATGDTLGVYAIGDTGTLMYYPFPAFIGTNSSDYINFFKTSKHYHLNGTNCPDPGYEEGEEQMEAPNQSEMDAAEQYNGTSLDLDMGDIILVIDELIMILEWCKSIQEVVMALIPPGMPFDFWDTFDAVFNVFTKTWGVGMHYWAGFEDLGVRFTSGGADYAEWLERAFPNEVLLVGDVVGVKGGRISKSFTDAREFMVISGQPIVLGNTPPAGLENLYEKVAFLGQVPVKIYGPVKEGDFVLMSGNADGIAIARDKSEMHLDDYQHIVGVAWEGSEAIRGGLPTIVNVAIGLNHNDLAEDVKKLRDAIVEVQSILIEAGYDLDLAISNQSSPMTTSGALSNQNSNAQKQPAAMNSSVSKPMDDNVDLDEILLFSSLSENDKLFLQSLFENGDMNIQQRHQFSRIVNSITKERFGTGFMENENFNFIHTILTDPVEAEAISREVASISAGIQAVLMEVNPNVLDFANPTKEQNESSERKR